LANPKNSIFKYYFEAIWLTESLLVISLQMPNTAIKASPSHKNITIKTLTNRRLVPKVCQFSGLSLSSHLPIYCIIMVIAFSHIFHPLSPPAPHFSLNNNISSFNFVD
jgi:hypothetical protein